MSANNLVIIGNGFDLAHGLKTSYKDFIDHVFNESERCFKQGSIYNDKIMKLDSAFSNREKYLDDLWHAPTTNWVFREILNGHSKNWCDIENIYYKLLLSIKDNDIETAKQLNEGFQSIKDELIKYLLGIEKPDPIKEFEDIFQKLEEENTCYINFNYTDTLKSYVIDPKSIHYIHGNLRDDNNPVIFGYGASYDDIQSLNSKFEDTNSHHKFIKYFDYKINESYDIINLFIEEYEFFELHIIGHSCGISDEQLLRKISNSNLGSIKLYYHKDYIHYRELQSNLSRILNEDSFNKIYSYLYSVKCPQCK